MKNATRFMAIVCGLTTFCARGEDPAPAMTKEQIVTRYPSIKAEQVQDGPDGLYELTANGAVSYLTADGNFLIRGEIIDLRTRENLTEARQNAKRANLLAAIDPATEIVFAPKGTPKHTLTVFTDVDCGYCRQFHRQIALVNELGIEVRYVAFPRTGPNTDSWAKAERVWCATDRQTALTQAKLGAEIEQNPDCKSNPVAEEYQLGLRAGVNSTPSVYTEDGVQVGGYVPAADLVRLLDKQSQRTKP